MEKTELKRQQILNKIADHLLASGMKDSSLRHLAAAIGTSDRMLLHYFSDKEELMSAVLNLVAARLIQLLENTPEQMPFETLIPYLAGMIKDPRIRPHLRLWLELTAMSTANETYRLIARQICDGFYEWISSVLRVEKTEERAPMAALAFATIEGFVLMDALDYGSKVTSALEGIAMR